MSPQRTDLVLTANIPHIELCVFVCNSLDVEADGGDGGDVLVKLELVEDCCAVSVFGVAMAASGSVKGRERTCLAGGVEPQHQQAHFLGSEDLVQCFGY